MMVLFYKGSSGCNSSPQYGQLTTGREALAVKHPSQPPQATCESGSRAGSLSMILFGERSAGSVPLFGAVSGDASAASARRAALRARAAVLRFVADSADRGPGGGALPRETGG